MLSHQTLLDIWDLSDEDIKKYGYFCGRLNESECPVPPVRGAKVDALKEAPVYKHDYDFEHCRQDKARISPVSHLVTSYSLSDDDDMNVKSVSSCVREKTVCDWCNWSNELQLSWCENCGHVVNSSQDKCETKDLCNHKVQTSVNSGTKNSTSSYSRTHRCLESRAKYSSYQRHWKTSSLSKSPTKQFIPKIGTASKYQCM